MQHDFWWDAYMNNPISQKRTSQRIRREIPTAGVHVNGDVIGLYYLITFEQSHLDISAVRWMCVVSSQMLPSALAHPPGAQSSREERYQYRPMLPTYVILDGLSQLGMQCWVLITLEHDKAD